MRPVGALAASAISALGRGRAAYAVGEPGDSGRTALCLDPEGANGSKTRLMGRVRLESPVGSADRAEVLLTLALNDLVSKLETALPGFRNQRLAVVLGTSAGAMNSMEKALASRASLTPELAARASYFSPLRGVETTLGAPATVVQLLAACASSTLAIGFACRWLEAGLFDIVIAGGYDALSEFVTSGFDALGALSQGEPRPFRGERDGMALGEGAALVALRSGSDFEGCLGSVLGFGASSDAVHVTAPDASGAGLARAAREALEDAGLSASDIDLVSAHGTATVFNDAAEARALVSLFGARPMPVFPFKAVIGHTLGAAGVLETLAAWDALSRKLLPASPGTGPTCSEGCVVLPEVNELRSIEKALKLSAAFGGANAALVLGKAATRAPGRRRPVVPVELLAVGPHIEHASPELLSRLVARASASALSRLDSLSELVVAAAARLIEGLPGVPPPRTAVVVGTESATLEVNELYDRRRRAGLAVEPRRFPATSPNVCAGWCSIAFGFLGPSFSVGSGAGARLEALAIGHDLVAQADADAALVVAAEDVGSVVTDFFGAAGLRVPRRGAQALLLIPAQTGTPLDRSKLSWPVAD